MSFCIYCGGNVANSRCLRCYCLQPGVHRRYVDETDAGFSERVTKLSIVVVIAYFSLVIFYKFSIWVLRILNR